jgi:hypothetical protein
MRCECYRIGGPFIAEDPNCPIHGYEAQAREKEERAYRESEEEKQNELLARIIALEEKIDAMPQCAQPAPSIPEGWMLVPIEPTEKMINEGTCASTLPGPRYIDSACAKQCWEYMLAAAPKPEESK